MPGPNGPEPNGPGPRPNEPVPNGPTVKRPTDQDWAGPTAVVSQSIKPLVTQATSESGHQSINPIKGRCYITVPTIVL